MIESIYSKEHVDVMKSGVHTMFRFPKNIRQIGQVEGTKSVYVEDYVMTYIRQIAMKNTDEYQFAILLGKFIHIEENSSIFISGAVCVKEINIEESMVFSNDAWTSIYGDIKKYFTDVEIVGWFLTKQELSFEVDDKIKKIHLDNFAGQDKTLLMYDSTEKEEAFYIYAEGSLLQQKGYYIYYEKNEEMQQYMIEQKNTKSEESDYEDRAIKEIRHVIASKKEVSREKKIAHIVYGASTFLAAVILIVGASMLNNYDKMDSLEETLNSISENLNHQGEKAAITDSTASVEENDTTEVETMKGNVVTIKQEEVQGDEIENTSTPKENIKKEKTKEKQKRKKKSTEDSEEEKKYYIVKKGDTLATISIDQYNSIHHVSEIQEANGIEDQDKIYIGEKLIIPK